MCIFHTQLHTYVGMFVAIQCVSAVAGAMICSPLPSDLRISHEPTPSTCSTPWLLKLFLPRTWIGSAAFPGACMDASRLGTHPVPAVCCPSETSSCGLALGCKAVREVVARSDSLPSPSSEPPGLLASSIAWDSTPAVLGASMPREGGACVLKALEWLEGLNARYLSEARPPQTTPRTATNRRFLGAAYSRSKTTCRPRTAVAGLGAT